MLALERFLEVAEEPEQAWSIRTIMICYDGKLSAHPVIDYQAGSLRDDFEFGPLLFYNSAALIKAVAGIKETLEYAGLYQLRLKVSQHDLPW